MSLTQSKDLILIKYGGNAMLDDEITLQIAEKVAALKEQGYRVVIVHGGGPFIEDNLKLAGIESEFIEGHRKTTEEAMKYIEMALKGHVNSNLVKLLNRFGQKAVGLSGKDGKMVKVVKRFHVSDKGQKIDLGYVGDVNQIDPSLLNLLLNNQFIPVISTIAYGDDGKDYNVNADMFAGHLAGALKANYMIVLTDVDGLMEDPDSPESLINEIHADQIEEMKGKIIKGGMIPKTEACKIAVENGAKKALIMNGKKPGMISNYFNNPSQAIATKILK